MVPDATGKNVFRRKKKTKKPGQLAKYRFPAFALTRDISCPHHRILFPLPIYPAAHCTTLLHVPLAFLFSSPAPVAMPIHSCPVTRSRPRPRDGLGRPRLRKGGRPRRRRRRHRVPKELLHVHSHAPRLRRRNCRAPERPRAHPVSEPPGRRGLSRGHVPRARPRKAHRLLHGRSARRERIAAHLRGSLRQ